MIRAFSELYDLKDGELIIPIHYASMGAIGAVLNMLETNTTSTNKISLDKLIEYLKKGFEQKGTKKIDNWTQYRSFVTFVFFCSINESDYTSGPGGR